MITDRIHQITILHGHDLDHYPNDNIIDKHAASRVRQKNTYIAFLLLILIVYAKIPVELLASVTSVCVCE